MKVVILGGGESGVGAAILAKDKGYEVFLSDMGVIKPKYIAMLDSENIEYESGRHTPERILDADLVIKSPGIPKEAPMMRRIAERGIPVVSEIEFAGRFTDSMMICITGSNGKTTTTMLTHHILQKAGVNAGLAGNIGNSLAYQVAREPHPVYVIELSSFQLDNMYDFKADIAILMNITPDHLDRYDNKFENYAEAKLRILQNMTEDDAFIYWNDDPEIRNRIEDGRKIMAKLLPFAERDDLKPMPYGFTNYEDVFIRIPGKEPMQFPYSTLSLKGTHNLYNSLAATMVAVLMDIPAQTICSALSDFKGVEHRLEYVATIDGVRYINDSKATNVDSAYYALGAMTTPTVLILGGKDKGNDYNAILPLVKEKVKAIVAMGLHNEKIIDFFQQHVPVKETNNLADAIELCRNFATPGDTVLLSPCCASFDLFSSYEDRGRQFKKAVLNMNHEHLNK